MNKVLLYLPVIGMMLHDIYISNGIYPYRDLQEETKIHNIRLISTLALLAIFIASTIW